MPNRRSLRTAALALLVPVLGACRAEQPAPIPEAGAPSSAVTFWNGLRELCGKAYEGSVIEAPAGDTTFAGKRLVMHVRSCTEDEIRIPFHVGTDRSRTWVLTRVGDAYRLMHDHRHADGSEDEITQYGGDSRAGAHGLRQEFAADEHTASLIPAAATNVWTVEVVPGETFVYALRREGTDRRFRIVFDLTRPVSAPPPPWGAGDRDQAGVADRAGMRSRIAVP